MAGGGLILCDVDGNFLGSQQAIAVDIGEHDNQMATVVVKFVIPRERIATTINNNNQSTPFPTGYTKKTGW